LQEAFDDFACALKSARQWRAEVLPADAFRISTEVELHDVYSSFIELGTRLYEQSGERRFAEETFAAAEESRAASLRALWAGPDLTKRLPEAYWQTLAELHQEEGLLAGDQESDGRSAIHQLRLKLAEMEARAGLDFPVVPEIFEGYDNKLMDRVRRTLRSTDVFLGYHLGNDLSCLWVIDREGFSLKTLPRRSQLAEDARMFVEALRRNSREATRLGIRLYSELFGKIEASRLDRPMWIVAPDGPLFELPFAALPAGSESDSDKHYLIERHAIQIVPGISALLGKEQLNLTRLAIGVGDPIYNRADSRLLSLKRDYANSMLKSQLAPRLELARLVGSAREITSCARIWSDRGFEPILLEGAAANRANLVAALRRDPAVVHVAAHLLFPAQQEGVGLVALGLQPSGDLDLLSATEISSMRINVGIVVLNACRSGQAPALPGAGLMGMTRAWMAAGAHAVIATRWPTDDQQDGRLFQSFYSHLASVRLRPAKVAELLQEAQLIELRSGGPRANPAYWAAYFCVERN
jgi:CHAT domain-containing protein